MTDRNRVALFSGINVGGHRKVKMADLKAVFEAIGLREAVTHVQSGNVVFDGKERPPRELAREIGEAFEARFGFASETLVRTREDWRAMIEANPFRAEATDPTKVHALVLAETPAPQAVSALEALDGAPDLWRLGEGVLYLHTPEGLGRSKFAPRIGRTLKVRLTQRNWSTVLALARLMQPPA